MRSYEDFIKIDCKTFFLRNITEELFMARENFCTGRCEECLMHKNYYLRGLSCNEALNKYPSDCMDIFKEEKAQPAS